MKPFRLQYLSVLIFCISSVYAQKKYPSLFWEITGNGLQKPSYLFGTMHVSNKMVFHLSDSFYHAMRNADAVALELNPELWQDQMFKVQKAQQNFSRFTGGRAMNDYIRERSFQLQKYDDDLKRALTEEPTVVNNLLYRSYQSSADFEENTYLDLYIYQTGRKLGKRPGGVEDYIQSERLVQEAYLDMAKEKSRKPIDTDGVSPFQIQRSIQEAYRKGDLDVMDSLETLTTTSPAFNEKFLYVRNEIQANSIDTILQKHSLFVGVGAAHLPGTRGVIELLRKRGYTLRPIFMQDRNAAQKDEIDKMKVPVTFRDVSTEDGAVSLKLPGDFYKREESRNNESWQYADMNNGSYYMLTRVATHAGMLGQSKKDVVEKINSLLYENIPGRIIKKVSIIKDGLPGFDITNRTRRGDIQRYQIIVSPFEVLVFKMSGNENYVEGKEGETFFNSIRISNTSQNNWVAYQPKYGGFTVQLPNNVHQTLNKKTIDRIPRMEYEAIDNNGNAYMIWRKSVYNLNFLEEDTFDLALMEESFQRSELIDKRLGRRIGVDGNIPFIESEYTVKDSGFIITKAFIKGPHYYLLAARSKKLNADPSFFTSFKFSDFKYAASEMYVDSSLNIRVLTSSKPDIDISIRQWMEKARNDAQATSRTNNTSARTKNGLFTNDSTGESILVTVENYPKYYYSRDTAKFWKEKPEERFRKDMVFTQKEYFRLNDSVSGYKIVLRDTNSSRSILLTYILKANSLIRLATVTDTAANKSEYVKQFFATAKPIEKPFGPSVFKNKLDVFFADYTSKDSTTSKDARQSLSNLYYGKDGVDKISEAINHLKFGDKDYFEIKSKFITELGYIDDSSSKERLVVILKDLYEKNADTSYFQNAVLSSLARLQTRSSFKVIKDIILRDPPVFDNAEDYSGLFNQFADTLPLAKSLFPEILQLASLEDYKPHVNNLLKAMVDSGFMKAKNYDHYFTRIYLDAKVQMKKQQNKDEKKLQQETSEEDNASNFGLRNLFSNISGSYNNAISPLQDFAVLLAPFYDRKDVVPFFFEKLLQSKDVNIQLTAAKVLLANNKKLPDTLLTSIASQDRYRAKLLAMLEKIGKKDLFPAKYNNQEDIARSILLNDRNYNRFADLKLVDKQVLSIKGDRGLVYLFKYKINAGDDWKMGISGIQPLNAKEVSSKVDIVKLTDRKLRPDQPVNDQFDQQIKRLLFTQHKSSRQFYENGGGGFNFNGGD